MLLVLFVFLFALFFMLGFFSRACSRRFGKARNIVVTEVTCRG